MSIEVLNESGLDFDVRRLSRLARFVMDEMRVHPQAELCIKAVDEDTIAQLNGQWMEKEGPTDVLAFPMDELRPGKVNEEPEEGVLGDLVLAPAVAERQGVEAGHGREAEIDLPGGTKSGLKVVEEILTGVEDVVFNRLTSHDVVRHRLVGRIVAAYDEFDARGGLKQASQP